MIARFMDFDELFSKMIWSNTNLKRETPYSGLPSFLFLSDTPYQA